MLSVFLWESHFGKRLTVENDAELELSAALYLRLETVLNTVFKHRILKKRVIVHQLTD
jgi:hypothetical protein